MGIRSLTATRSDHRDLIQRQPTLAQTPGAARELPDPMGDRRDRRGIGPRGARLPGHQRSHRTRPRGTPKPVPINLRNDIHNAPINGIALTRQLRQLVEQHRQPLLGTDFRSRLGNRR